MSSTVPSTRSHVGDYGLDGSSSVAHNGFSHSATTTIIEKPSFVQSQLKAQSQSLAQHQPKAKSQKIQRSAAKNAGKKIRAKIEMANKPGVKRAMRLRKEYPQMQGIPNSISAKAKRNLVAEFEDKQYKADGPIPDNTPTINAPAKPPRTRRKPKNNNRGGTSTNNPITID